MGCDKVSYEITVYLLFQVDAKGYMNYTGGQTLVSRL